jgi:hypothetical protein
MFLSQDRPTTYSLLTSWSGRKRARVPSLRNGMPRPCGMIQTFRHYPRLSPSQKSKSIRVVSLLDPLDRAAAPDDPGQPAKAKPSRRHHAITEQAFGNLLRRLAGRCCEIDPRILEKFISPFNSISCHQSTTKKLSNDQNHGTTSTRAGDRRSCQLNAVPQRLNSRKG